jgi:hypothetical protein
MVPTRTWWEQQETGWRQGAPPRLPVAGGAMLLALVITTVAIWVRRTALTGTTN